MRRDRRRPLRPVLFALLAMLVAAAVAPAGSEASFPGRNGNLGLVVVTRSNDAFPPTFSQPRVVSLTGRRDPRFERRIDATCRSRLDVTAPDSEAEGVYCDGLGYSPSGRRIASGYFDPLVGTRILLVNSHGLGRRLFPPPPQRPYPVHDWAPVWSPDGRRLAFARTPDECQVDPRRGVSDCRDAIYTIARNGEGLRRLTEGRAPAWSSRGRIAFLRENDIYVMRSDGTQVRRIRRMPRDRFPGTLDWSPDGKRIVFGHDRSETAQPITVMRADGTRARRLASGSYPVWSPDGRLIAFTRSDPDNELTLTLGLYVMSSGGGPVRRVIGMRPFFDLLRGDSTIEITDVDWQSLPR